METLLIFLRGLLMGMADAVPGVSGGTIAFITGIYHRLIHAISKIHISLLIKGNFKKFYKNLDLKLFIPLGAGIAIALFTFSKLMGYLLTNKPSLTFAFFFGLILASPVVLFKSIGKIDLKKISFAVIGFVGAYLLSSPTTFQINHSLPFIFLAGAIAICAMILPGISGAFLLLLLGQYHYIITAIHEFNFKILAVFGLGALTGILAFSKLLDYLMHHFKSLVLSFLIGLMLGSLRIPIAKVVEDGSMNILVLLLGVLGFLLVFIMEWYFAKKV
ncbi:DUF368 domain-containing protein [Candidatus Woesearchaeota archaeon]|nr:DUF368 domain-containing protein [Candidatus Woesearchaeota archaeon]